MRAFLRDFSVCVFAWFLITVFVSFIVPGFAAGSVGVKEGDWVKYTGSASGLEPDGFLGLGDMDWMKGELMSVRGNTVTVQMTAHYKNGSEQEQILVGDVVSGSGNLTFMIMPAGMEIGDALPFAMFDLGGVSMVVNDTVSRSYMGISRIVNVLSVSVEDFASVEVYWDKGTGVLMELSMEVSALGHGMDMSIEAVETNMWSANSMFGGDLSTNLIYLVGIVAVVIAVAAVALTLFLRKSRLPSAPIPPVVSLIGTSATL